LRMRLALFSLLLSTVSASLDANVEADFFHSQRDDALLRQKRDSSDVEEVVGEGMKNAAAKDDPLDLKIKDDTGKQLAWLKTSKPITIDVVQRDEKGKAHVKGSVTLSGTPAIQASEFGNGNVNVALTYTDFSKPSDSLNITAKEVQISFNLNIGMPRSDYWNMSGIVVSLKISNGTTGPQNITEDLTPKSGYTPSIADASCTNGYSICAPLSLSWTCSGQLLHNLQFSSIPATDYSMRVLFTDLQLQLGGKTSWSNAWDCDPLLSIGLWSTLLVSLLMVSILTYAIAMVTSMSTPDKFDDPKGPVLNLGQQNE